jgi:hypothetical protein
MLASIDPNGTRGVGIIERFKWDEIGFGGELNGFPLNERFFCSKAFAKVYGTKIKYEKILPILSIHKQLPLVPDCTILIFHVIFPFTAGGYCSLCFYYSSD